MTREQLATHYESLWSKAQDAETLDEKKKFLYKARQVQKIIEAMDKRYYNFWNVEYKKNIWE